MSPSSTHKYAFVDALRGYAVLMVITCHIAQAIPNLPFRVKNLTNFGWHGVQLFFLVSCVTLMMSWKKSEREHNASVWAFWLRRLFRIAPMYYIAAALYFFLDPPASGFDAGQLLASASFMVAWDPLWLPVVLDRWNVVPGSWTVGDEFGFYLLLPFVVPLVTTPRRAGIAVGLMALVALLCDPIGFAHYAPLYGTAAADNFVYYWFPNQAQVFAAGMVLYFIVAHLLAQPAGRLAQTLRKRRLAIMGASLALAVFTANMTLPHWYGRGGSVLPTTMMVAVLLMTVFVTVLAAGGRTLLVNTPVRLLGRYSFSAYLLHSAMVICLSRALPTAFRTEVEGFPAIGHFLMFWSAVLALTFLGSALTYHLVEKPMMGLGGELIRWRLNAKVAAAAAGNN